MCLIELNRGVHNGQNKQRMRRIPISADEPLLEKQLGFAITFAYVCLAKSHLRADPNPELIEDIITGY